MPEPVTVECLSGRATIDCVADPTVSIVSAERTRELRRRVLRPHQAVDDPLPGDDVRDAIHFAILDGAHGAHGAHGARSEPLCACFLLVEGYPWVPAPGSPPADRPLWHLRSVATEPAHQRTGLGRVLMQAVLDHVAGHGGGVLWCNARTPAVPFYQRIGLATYGDEHISHGLAHYWMWCPVAAAGTAT